MEGAPETQAHIKPEESGQVEKIPEEIKRNEQIEFRRTQEFSSRLAEYITGLRPEDPRIIERLIEDQKIIRARYGLPQTTEIRKPSEYERFLKDVAHREGVRIKEKSECGDFFEKNRVADAVHFGGEKKIGVDIDKTDVDTYNASLVKLEHELIHALQHSKSPNMPIELMEYEAYVAGGNMDVLKENQRAVELLFSYLIGGSVLFWYSSQSKQSQTKVEPQWNNPDYFLEKVDGVEVNNTK